MNSGAIWKPPESWYKTYGLKSVWRYYLDRLILFLSNNGYKTLNMYASVVVKTYSTIITVISIMIDDVFYPGNYSSNHR